MDTHSRGTQMADRTEANAWFTYSSVLLMYGLSVESYLHY